MWGFPLAAGFPDPGTAQGDGCVTGKLLSPSLPPFPQLPVGMMKSFSVCRKEFLCVEC